MCDSGERSFRCGLHQRCVANETYFGRFSYFFYILTKKSDNYDVLSDNLWVCRSVAKLSWRLSTKFRASHFLFYPLLSPFRAKSDNLVFLGFVAFCIAGYFRCSSFIQLCFCSELPFSFSLSFFLSLLPSSPFLSLSPPSLLPKGS